MRIAKMRERLRNLTDALKIKASEEYAQGDILHLPVDSVFEGEDLKLIREVLETCRMSDKLSFIYYDGYLYPFEWDMYIQDRLSFMQEVM